MCREIGSSKYRFESLGRFLNELISNEKIELAETETA
jgi:hypothetical protein